LCQFQLTRLCLFPFQAVMFCCLLLLFPCGQAVIDQLQAFGESAVFRFHASVVSLRPSGGRFDGVSPFDGAVQADALDDFFALFYRVDQTAIPGGGFGFRINKSLALGMVKPEYAAVGTTLDIEILGKSYSARVVPDSPFDPKNERLRDVNDANK
jgi:hypothetical protein